MIGPETSSIASRVASIGDRPMWMCRSTFSTTTIASSTTMPIARTMPKSESVLSEKPSSSMTAKVPTSEIGTATSGMIDARQVWRKTITTIDHQQDGDEQRLDDRANRLADEDRRVVDDAVVHALGKRLLQPLHRGANLIGGLDRVRPRPLEDADRHCRLVVEQAAQRVRFEPSSTRPTSRIRVIWPSCPARTTMSAN